MRQDCVRGAADCKSAIRQIANLRYVTELASACTKPRLVATSHSSRSAIIFAKQFEMTLDPFYTDMQDEEQRKASMAAQQAVRDKAQQILGEQKWAARVPNAFERRYGLSR